MTPRGTIVAAMAHPNVRAFQHVVKHRESNHTDRAYMMVNGRPDLTSLAVHPYYGITTTNGARASGAYQYLGTTWSGVAERYPQDCADFGVYAQDFGSVVKMDDRGALDDIMRGDLYTAIKKCRKEWTSLPGAEENTGYTFEQALAIYKQYGGGTFQEQEPAPIEERGTEAQPQQGTDMGAGLLMALVQTVIGAFAPLAQQKMSQAISKHGGDPTAAGAIMDGVLGAISTATGNSVQAMKDDPKIAIQSVSAVQADPAMLQQVETDSLAALDKLAPVLDKLHQMSKDEWAAEDASQQAAFERNKADPSQNIQKPMMTFTMAIVGVVTMFTGGLLGWQMYLKDGEEPNGQLIILFVMLVTTFVNMLRTQNDWSFGSSRSSAGKDETIRQMAKLK